MLCHTHRRALPLPRRPKVQSVIQGPSYRTVWGPLNESKITSQAFCLPFHRVRQQVTANYLLPSTCSGEVKVGAPPVDFIRP